MEKTPGCHCRNHLGGFKQQYKTREDAVEAILTHHMRNRKGGSFSVYQCKNSDRWHVKTEGRLKS